VAVALFLVVGCSLAFRETRDWSFIQSVGGISVGQPVSTQDGWYLPVNCDVSGLQTTTVKPTQLNSALVCYKVLATGDNQTIFISVQTSVAGSGPGTSSCRAVNIGNLRKGRYSIRYKDPNGMSHEVGSIEI
jgi:hypothetical protein